MQKALDQRINTAKSVKKVAGILGFESAADWFKPSQQRIGVSPRDGRVNFAGQRRGEVV